MFKSVFTNNYSKGSSPPALGGRQLTHFSFPVLRNVFSSLGWMDEPLLARPKLVSNLLRTDPVSLYTVGREFPQRKTECCYKTDKLINKEQKNKLTKSPREKNNMPTTHSISLQIIVSHSPLDWCCVCCPDPGSLSFLGCHFFSLCSQDPGRYKMNLSYLTSSYPGQLLSLSP